MRYAETKQQSAELLRLIIPLMSKHEAACNPMTYALWYEYLAGLNTPLKQAMDEIIDGAKILTNPLAEQLYRRHIMGRDDEAQDKYESDFKRLVGEVSGAATQAEVKASDYVSALGRHGSVLQSAEGSEAVAGVMQELLNDTLLVRESVGLLNDELKASLREVEELRKELERTQGQALIDPLTGVKNRRGLEKVVEDLQALGSSGMIGSSLMMIDIDHFKKINDSHGHLLGDKVIRSVAQLLVAAVKGRDTVSRWGGEEFVILLPGTPLSGATALAGTIKTMVERGRIRRMDSSDYIGAVTVSVGVACHQPGESFDDLLQRADRALYAAKAAGRNRVMAAP
ncbi:MAG: GGDEF domain-containing protein [Burkholderiales bacterium]